jgi:DNA modification methylase
MGKKWDYDVPQVELWKEVYRVLKPGGHILSFAGSRTYHRMAVNIEDAGFEIRDMLGWLYGSGFPKSHNIGKAVDKFGGNNHLSKKIASELKKARTKRNITLKQADILFCNGSTNYSWYEGRPAGQRIPDEKTFEKISDEWFELKEISKLVKQAEREVVGKKTSGIGTAFGEGEWKSGKAEEVDITIPKTEQAKQWEGWGTALKPAHEPIVMARKPFNTSVAENVLTHGTGGINIDECRVGTDEIKEKTTTGGKKAFWNADGNNKGFQRHSGNGTSHEQGRFPANIMHDGSEEVLEIFPETSPSKRHYRTSPKNKNVCYGVYNENNTIRGHNDEGTAARFFYCAKASKAERNMGLDNLAWEKENFETKKAGGMSGRNDGSMGSITYNKNHHPTVKPIKLMEYLVRLVTPKEGIVLEPFAGSGTTLIACKQQGFNYIGIEREKEYCDIAEARLKGVQIQGTLF